MVRTHTVRSGVRWAQPLHVVRARPAALRRCALSNQWSSKEPFLEGPCVITSAGAIFCLRCDAVAVASIVAPVAFQTAVPLLGQSYGHRAAIKLPVATLALAALVQPRFHVLRNGLQRRWNPRYNINVTFRLLSTLANQELLPFSLLLHGVAVQPNRLLAESYRA